MVLDSLHTNFTSSIEHMKVIFGVQIEDAQRTKQHNRSKITLDIYMVILSTPLSTSCGQKNVTCIFSHFVSYIIILSSKTWIYKRKGLENNKIATISNRMVVYGEKCKTQYTQISFHLSWPRGAPDPTLFE